VTKRTTAQQHARKLQKAESIGYHEALNRVREQAAAANAPSPAESVAVGQSENNDGELHSLPSEPRLIDLLSYARALLPAGEEFLSQYASSEFARLGFPPDVTVTRTLSRREALASVIYGLPHADEQVFATDRSVTIRHASGYVERLTRLDDAGARETTL
jgi:hypothetical protein